MIYPRQFLLGKGLLGLILHRSNLEEFFKIKNQLISLSLCLSLSLLLQYCVSDRRDLSTRYERIMRQIILQLILNYHSGLKFNENFKRACGPYAQNLAGSPNTRRLFQIELFPHRDNYVCSSTTSHLVASEPNDVYFFLTFTFSLETISSIPITWWNKWQVK